MENSKNKADYPVCLIILDGWGISGSKLGNAVFSAKKPNMDSFMDIYPNTKLLASGLAVGLPEGQMGNSEVGHLNIGAGRIVYQDLTKISRSIELAKKNDVKNLFLHAFLDGRDVPPRSALTYLEEIKKFMDKEGYGEISTVSGRY